MRLKLCNAGFVSEVKFNTFFNTAQSLSKEDLNSLQETCAKNIKKQQILLILKYDYTINGN